MYKVGVTGGIGSGKSVVCKIFRNLDIPVYDADTKARRLIAEDAGIRDELIRNFGKKIFSVDGLNRKYLAKKIFTDSGARAFVNELVHPRVRQDFREWVKIQEGPYVIEEAALLFESGGWKELDFTIVVLAREETRIRRIMKRDGIERGDVLARLASQIDPSQAVKMADFRIQNDENEFVIPQVLEADRIIRKRLKSG
jgi:dephospho-CoA kinase